MINIFIPQFERTYEMQSLIKVAVGMLSLTAYSQAKGIDSNAMNVGPRRTSNLDAFQEKYGIKIRNFEKKDPKFSENKHETAFDEYLRSRGLDSAFDKENQGSGNSFRNLLCPSDYNCFL